MKDPENGIQEELSDEDITDFKRREILRDVQQWETILGVNPYREGLNVVDSILRENDYELSTHLGGEGYEQVSLENQEQPDQVLLKIDDTAENLRENIDNHFFQSITEENKEYVIKEFPDLAFELGDTYDETFEVPTDYSNIEIRYPTHQSFYKQKFSQFDAQDYLSDE